MNYEQEEKCELGCKHFYGGEIAHHKDCVYYPDSRTKMFDDLEFKYTALKEASDYLAFVAKTVSILASLTRVQKEEITKALDEYRAAIDKIEGGK